MWESKSFIVLEEKQSKKRKKKGGGQKPWDRIVHASSTNPVRLEQSDWQRVQLGLSQMESFNLLYTIIFSLTEKGSH